MQFEALVTVPANYGGSGTSCGLWQRWQAAHPHTDMRGLTQEQLAEYLSVAYMPDPDLLIRTGGGQRIINFLLWQVAYAGLSFTDELWLEFDTAQLALALDCYQTRQRRFGQIAA